MSAGYKLTYMLATEKTFVCEFEELESKLQKFINPSVYPVGYYEILSLVLFGNKTEVYNGLPNSILTLGKYVEDNGYPVQIHITLYKHGFIVGKLIATIIEDKSLHQRML